MGKRKREAESQSAASHSSAAAASFAEGQLLKFGWKKGKGLGKDGHGIAKAIKVGHKQDTLGLGKDSDQWTVQWWDHVYNKTSASLKIAKTTDGSVTVASKALTAEEKREAHMSLLYRNFVPAKVTCFDPATLVDPTFDPDEEHEKYRTKLTDKELFEACGGRTAHKGARSTVSGKLARVDPDKLLNGKGAATGRNGDSSSEDEFEIRARMIAEEMEGRPARKPKSAPVRVPSPSQSESSGEQVVPERWARQPASTVNVVPVVDVKDADDVVGNAESDDDEPARAAPVKERKEKKKDKRRSEDAKDDDESDAAKKERRRKRKEEKRKQKEAHKAEEASADVETESREERRRRKEEKRWKKKEAV